MERHMRARMAGVESLRSTAENILRLGRAPSPEVPSQRDGELNRKGQAALDLVNAVADTISVTEGRIETLLARALDQLRTMEERNRSLEQQLKAAEQRAREAEKWLVRLHVAIEDKFTSWRATKPDGAEAA